MWFLMQLYYKHRIKGWLLIQEVYNLCRALFYIEENKFGHKACSRAVYMGNIYNDEQTGSSLEQNHYQYCAGQCVTGHLI